MNRKKRVLMLIAIAITIVIGISVSQLKFNSGKIYLYGEEHSNWRILDKEFEIWSKYYHEKGMRHLFVELPYYDAEFLNLWMKEDNDKLLNQCFEEFKGTAGGTPVYRRFFKRIKKECPETVFQGTDVGHGYKTTGERYLAYLQELGKEGSKEYERTKEVMEQGKEFYEEESTLYREKKMVENFKWEFDKLKNENIMGIYGAAHTVILEDNHTIMASQLSGEYQGRVYVQDLTEADYLEDELCYESLKINGRSYRSLYLVESWCNMEGIECDTVKIWRVEEKSEEFANNPAGEMTLAGSEYPILVTCGEIYVFDFYMNDEFAERKLFRADKSAMEDGTIMTREILYK